MPSPWSHQEITHTLNTYFQMLDREIHGQAYNKAAYRRQLLPKLNRRSESSIEFKHQNISAVLLKYQMPYIVGYKPLANYQALLEEMVLDYLVKRQDLDRLFDDFALGKSATSPQKIKYESLLVEAPQPTIAEEPRPEYVRKPRKTNWLKREQSNRSLGEQGEEVVIQYERWRLIQAGKENLAEQVEWISKDQGDGAGFDILSRNDNGSDRYIEVKTTKLGETTPFYFTRNELAFSQENATAFFLYRLFKFNHSPNLFIKHGSFDDICRYEATSFVGRVG